METTERPQTTIFLARGLTKVYRMGEEEIHALRGIDLEIEQGEFIVLLGPSGSALNQAVRRGFLNLPLREFAGTDSQTNPGKRSAVA